MIMDRLNFIQKFSSFLGISIVSTTLLESCTSNPEEEEIVLTEEEILYNSLKEKTSEHGKFLDGRILYIDVTHEDFSDLNTVGEFINDSDNYILILRKTVDVFQVFSNCCPHLGTTNQWSYNQGSFRCANHGNSYGTGTQNIARCGSRSTSGNLKQYQTMINQDILTIDFDS